MLVIEDMDFVGKFYDELMNYEMNGITHSVSLYCIFDGHNGEECAQICSREIDEIVSHEYSLFIDSFQSELLHLNNSNNNSNTTENEQRKRKEKEIKEEKIQETMKRIMKTLDEKVKNGKTEEMSELLQTRKEKSIKRKKKSNIILNN